MKPKKIDQGDKPRPEITGLTRLASPAQMEKIKARGDLAKLEPPKPIKDMSLEERVAFLEEQVALLKKALGIKA